MERWNLGGRFAALLPWNVKHALAAASPQPSVRKRTDSRRRLSTY
jgi:hypothetical protein